MDQQLINMFYCMRLKRPAMHSVKLIHRFNRIFLAYEHFRELHVHVPASMSIITGDPSCLECLF
jgi:hypothetical protein